MMHLLIRTQSVHSVPLNIVRENGRSQIYLGIPRSLTLGESIKVVRFCADKSQQHGAQCEGVLAGTFTPKTASRPQGMVVPRFVVWASTWRRNEALLRDELLRELPRLLGAQVVPVVRH